MTKIVLEDRFTTHQKITFLIYLGGFFLIAIVLFLKSSIESNLSYEGYFMLLVFVLIYILLIIMAFLKNGFVKMGSKLFKASFFRGKLIFQKEIDISTTKKVAVLKFRKTQKLVWCSAAKPDLAVGFNTFEINFLNNNHTKRNKILDLNNKDNIEPTIEFLTTNFDLKYEIYSPNFR